MVVFGEILQVFAEKTPVAVMVHGILERFLNPDKIDEWFDSVSEVQYTRKILFSSILGIMLQVVCKTRSSVHTAYLNSNIEATCSIWKVTKYRT
jgi:hypothetical protein